MNTSQLEKIAFACTITCSLLVSGVVLVSLALFLLSVSSLVMVPRAFGQSKPASKAAGVRLEAGIVKEEADGDLKAAMAIYQQVANEPSAPRELRAKALLRLAGCEEKLGQQARQVYEQIVHNYADQPVAAQARTRLAVLKEQDHPAVPATMTARRIDLPNSGQIGASDTDGQRAVYRDADGSLYFGDLAGHSKRLVFKAGAKDKLGWIPSRDFTQVALALPGKGLFGATTLAVVKTDGTGYRELVHDDMRGTIFANLGFRFNWSWDNRFLVVASTPEGGGGHLLLISTADGKRTELASAQPGIEQFAKIVVSPDGEFVAYELLSRVGSRSRIFLMPARGGEPRLVYQVAANEVMPFSIHPVLLDWTADGQNLLLYYSSGLNSNISLLPIKHGVVNGKLQEIRRATITGGWTTAAGALVYVDPSTGANFSRLFLASLDSDHVGNWNLINGQIGSITAPSGWPSFSPDGKEIAYSKRAQNAAELVVYNVGEAKERVLYRSTEGLFCNYANRTAMIFCTDPRGTGTTNILSISAVSGEVRQLGSINGFSAIFRPSEDDQILYLGQRLADASGTLRTSLVKWDANSHREVATEALSERDEHYNPVSIKAKWLLRRTKKDLSVRPIAGGDWKSVTSINHGGDQFTTTADEKWIIYHDTDASGKDRLFRVSIAGGKPEPIGDFPNNGNGFLLASPDGKWILAEAGNPQSFDLWILNNLLPTHSKP